MPHREEGPYVIVEKESGGGVGAFLLGAILGAGAALLLAPRSGEETQRDLKDRASRLRDVAEERVREVQEQLEARVDQARSDVLDRVERIREAVESGKEAAHEAREELEGRIERSKAAYRAGVDAARNEVKEEGEHT